MPNILLPIGEIFFFLSIIITLWDKKNVFLPYILGLTIAFLVLGALL